MLQAQEAGNKLNIPKEAKEQPYDVKLSSTLLN